MIDRGQNSELKNQVLPESQESKLNISIRRDLPRFDRLYVEGEVENIPLTFTIDTGATHTIISDRIFRRIPKNLGPELKKLTNPISGAGGNVIRELGKAEIDFKLGPLQLKKEIIVAEIQDEGLLGIDILQNEANGPADILLSQGILKLQYKIIPAGSKRIRCLNDYIIPPNNEIIIDTAIVKNKADEEIVSIEMFLELSPVLMADHLIMARSLDGKIQARMNPHQSEAQLRRHTIVGHLEPINGDICCLSREENEPNTAGRRIQLRPFWTAPEEIKIKLRSGKPELISPEQDVKVPHYLDELYKCSSTGKSKVEMKSISSMLRKFKNVFSQDDYDLGLTNLTEHVIDTENALPIKQAPRRVPHALADEEKQAIIELQEKGVIEKSTSSWSALIVLVRKRNGKIRPCVDYRRLNEVTRKDAFPLPRTQDCLDDVAGATLFSTFDLTSGYHQIPIKESDKPKTAFVTKYGLYQFNTTSFGLTNAPATFQRLIELLMQGLQLITF